MRVVCQCVRLCLLVFQPGLWLGNLSRDTGLFIQPPLPKTDPTLAPEGVSGWRMSVWVNQSSLSECWNTLNVEWEELKRTKQDDIDLPQEVDQTLLVMQYFTYHSHELWAHYMSNTLEYTSMLPTYRPLKYRRWCIIINYDTAVCVTGNIILSAFSTFLMTRLVEASTCCRYIS